MQIKLFLTIGIWKQTKIKYCVEIDQRSKVYAYMLQCVPSLLPQGLDLPLIYATLKVTALAVSLEQESTKYIETITVFNQLWSEW